MSKRSQTVLKPFNPKEYEYTGLTEAEIIEMKELFDMFDSIDGKIDPRYITSLMDSQGFKIGLEYFALQCPSFWLDYDHTRFIDFDEFLSPMSTRMSDREDIAQFFRIFDRDRTGHISLKNLRKVAQELGETITNEELLEMIEIADSDGERLVSFEDFYNICTKKVFPKN